MDFGFGTQTRQEVDYYAGWYWQATDEVSLDVGYLKYTYPKSSLYNLSDYYAALTVYGVTLGANYSNDTGSALGDDRTPSTATWPTKPPCRWRSACSCVTGAWTSRIRCTRPAMARHRPTTTNGK